MDVGERDLGMIKQYVDLLTGCKIKLSCARERLTIDVHCFYNKKQSIHYRTLCMVGVARFELAAS